MCRKVVVISSMSDEKNSHNSRLVLKGHETCTPIKPWHFCYLIVMEPEMMPQQKDFLFSMSLER